VGVKYWQIIADNLSKAWLHVGLRLRRSLQPVNDLRADMHRGENR